MSHEQLISQRGRWAAGQPITGLMQKALASPDLISLAAGFVDQESLPVEPTREAFEALWSEPARARAALQYGTTAGYPALREAVLARLVEADAHALSETSLDVEQVVLTAGSNQLLHLVADTLFDPGDIVLCSAPAYFVYLGVLRNMGVRSYGIAADEHGMIPESIDAAFRRLEAAGELGRVKAIYVVSYFDNPNSSTLSLERRPQLVELAAKWSKLGKIHVIEDAAYRALRYEGADLPSLKAFDTADEHVVYTETFSKSYSPGIRVGWGVLPRPLVGPVLEQKGNLDFGSPNFSQHLIHEVLRRDLFDPQVERVRQAYRPKRDAMIAALDEHLAPFEGVRWIEPEGGLYVWLELPEHVRTGPDGPLFDEAVKEGVLYVPGEYCYPAEGEPVAHHKLRLTFGVQSAPRIRAGIAALRRALERVLKTSMPRVPR